MRKNGTEKLDLLICGAAAVTMEDKTPYLACADIGIKNGIIQFVREHNSAEAACDAKTILDGSGCIALPGFVNAHSHIGMSYQRGFADDIALFDFLDRTFPVQRIAEEEDIYVFALLACAELIKSGYTSICDIMEHLPATVRAVDQSGLRGRLSPNIVDFHREKEVEGLLQRNLDFFETYHGAAGGRVGIDFNLHAPYSCSESLIRQIADAAEKHDATLHIHLAENQEEWNQIQENHHCTPTEYLDSLGVLGPNLLAAHAVKVTSSDIQLLRDRGVRVAHCPASNLKLASGFAPVPELHAAGVCVGLGTDSCVTNNSFNPFETMKITALIHKATHEDAALLPGKTVLTMATRDGARAIGLGEQAGILAAGKLADLVLLKMKGRAETTPHFLSRPDNIISHIVYAGQPALVDTVVINGALVYKNGKFQTLDERLLVAEAQERAECLLRKAGLLP